VPGDSFTVFHARRTFELATKPARFVVHVSADNRYRLYVNGVQVASGPQRSDVTHWRYETVDLAPNLRAGRNVVAALVWNWGVARPVAQFSNRTGFLLQGNSALEASLVVRNMLDPGHVEFNGTLGRSEIGRAALLQLRWASR